MSSTLKEAPARRQPRRRATSRERSLGHRTASAGPRRSLDDRNAWQPGRRRRSHGATVSFRGVAARNASSKSRKCGYPQARVPRRIVALRSRPAPVRPRRDPGLDPHPGGYAAGRGDYRRAGALAPPGQHVPLIPNGESHGVRPEFPAVTVQVPGSADPLRPRSDRGEATRPPNRRPSHVSRVTIETPQDRDVMPSTCSGAAHHQGRFS